MKKILIACCCILLHTLLVFGQVTRAKGSLAGEVNVSQLPSPGDSNLLWDVRDASSATDCTVGGGSTRIVCKWNGSAYAVIGGTSASSLLSGTSNTQVLFNDSGAFGGNSLFNFNKTNVQVGIGTATPGTAGSAAFTIPVLNVTNSSGVARIISQGTTQGGYEMINTGGGANLKWSQFVNNGGFTKLRAVNDDATAVQFTFFNLDHSNGRVRVGDATAPGATLDVSGTVLISSTLGVTGAVTGASFNGNTFTTGTYTLTGVAGKTLTFNKTLTLEGTDSTTMTFPTTSATIARTDAANTFTGHQTVEGVTSTGATGTGKFVFDTAPTFTTSVSAPVGSLTSAGYQFAAIGSGAGMAYPGSGGVSLIDNGSASITTLSGDVYVRPGAAICWSSSGAAGSSAGDTCFNRVSGGTVGVGTAIGAGFAGSLKFTNAVIVGKATTYNNQTTAGQGLTTILGMTSQKAETASADANVLTVTPASAVGTYRISVQISVSAATSGVIGWTATWTDSNGNAQTPTNLSLFQSGTAAPALTFTTSAAGNYYGEAIIDINNAGTNIVIKWTGGGTTTAKMSAFVERIN